MSVIYAIEIASNFYDKKNFTLKKGFEIFFVDKSTSDTKNYILNGLLIFNQNLTFS